jgi:hypothetical protein
VISGLMTLTQGQGSEAITESRSLRSLAMKSDRHSTDHLQRPFLTGDSTTDTALWHLSLILREISLGKQADDRQARESEMPTKNQCHRPKVNISCVKQFLNES